jgi:hypothetical protein
LLADDRAAFDSMVSYSLKYARGAEAYRDRRAFDLFAMFSLLSHEERLRVLEDGLKVRMRVDRRLEDWL